MSLITLDPKRFICVALLQLKVKMFAEKKLVFGVEILLDLNSFGE